MFGEREGERGLKLGERTSGKVKERFVTDLRRDESGELKCLETWIDRLQIVILAIEKN